MNAEFEFFIAFSGPQDRFACLSRFFDRVGDIKPSCVDLDFRQRGTIIDDPKWLDLLDEPAMKTLKTDDAWSLEDILDCLLTGEYDLVSLDFADGHGRLTYDPHAFPFGGTDPLKGFVESFGFTVTRDSFHDSYRESQL